MKYLPLVVALIPMLAFAGKSEREYFEKTLTPAIEAAQKDFKEACGCPLKIVVDESAKKSEDIMYQFKHSATTFTENAKGYCTDKASKDAMCKMKQVTFTYDKAKPETKLVIDEKTGRATASTDGSSYIPWQMYTDQLDK